MISLLSSMISTSRLIKRLNVVVEHLLLYLLLLLEPFALLPEIVFFVLYEVTTLLAEAVLAAHLLDGHVSAVVSAVAHYVVGLCVKNAFFHRGGSFLCLNLIFRPIIFLQKTFVN